ncbi:MAG TPA: hypothetical protein VGP88_08175, partial [Thermoplasmata archaeon]|nr:hypothetical protein [Thermoplasmata archaeon]
MIFEEPAHVVPTRRSWECDEVMGALAARRPTHGLDLVLVLSVVAIVLVPVALVTTGRMTAAPTLPRPADVRSSALPLPAPIAAAGSAGVSSSWPLDLGVATNVSAVCAFAGDACSAAPASMQVHLSAAAPNV